MSYLSLPLAIAASVLWVYFFAPIALRLFGLRVPIAPFYERIEILRRLGFPRFISSYGLLTYGMAGFIYFISNAFFEWRFSGAWALGFVPLPFNAGSRMFFVLATSMAVGIFIAWLAWKRQESSATRSGV